MLFILLKINYHCILIMNANLDTNICGTEGQVSQAFINRRDINSRIYERNIPSQPLQAYLDVRSVPTKYSIMPIVDPRAPISVNMVQLPIYNINSTFNPGNTQSPWSGYASRVNSESELRNQIFALQKCSQAAYVPNSNSDLYNYGFTPKNNVEQPFQELFRKEKFDSFNPNIENVGHSLFMNNTRVQVRDIPDRNKCD